MQEAHVGAGGMGETLLNFLVREACRKEARGACSLLLGHNPAHHSGGPRRISSPSRGDREVRQSLVFVPFLALSGKLDFRIYSLVLWGQVGSSG